MSWQTVMILRVVDLGELLQEEAEKDQDQEVRDQVLALPGVIYNECAEEVVYAATPGPRRMIF